MTNPRGKSSTNGPSNRSMPATSRTTKIDIRRMPSVCGPDSHRVVRSRSVISDAAPSLTFGRMTAICTVLSRRCREVADLRDAIEPLAPLHAERVAGGWTRHICPIAFGSGS